MQQSGGLLLDAGIDRIDTSIFIPIRNENANESRYSDHRKALNSLEFSAFLTFQLFSIEPLSQGQQKGHNLYVLTAIDSNTERICYQWQTSPRTKADYSALRKSCLIYNLQRFIIFLQRLTKKKLSSKIIHTCTM